MLRNPFPWIPSLLDLATVNSLDWQYLCLAVLNAWATPIDTSECSGYYGTVNHSLDMGEIWLWDGCPFSPSFPLLLQEVFTFYE